MEIEDLKGLWCLERPEADGTITLSREDLTMMVQQRARDVTMRLRRRLKREIGAYVAILAVLLPGIFYNFRPTTLGFAAALSLVLAGIMMTLRRGSRKLEALSLEGSAREALHRALRVVEDTMRSYMIAYMLCVVLGVAVGAAVIVLEHPFDPRWIVPTLLVALATTAWSYTSGRAYLDRHFGHYRSELTRCLETLGST